MGGDSLGSPVPQLYRKTVEREIYIFQYNKVMVNAELQCLQLPFVPPDLDSLYKWCKELEKIPEMMVEAVNTSHLQA
jgi:hypothetical protein